MHHIWYATAETAGMFAIFRSCTWTTVLIGKGTPLERVATASRQLMTRAEREAGRAAFGLPAIDDDPHPPADKYLPTTWDHSLVPAGHRIEEAPDGVIQAIAEWEVAGHRSPAEREADHVLPPEAGDDGPVGAAGREQA